MNIKICMAILLLGYGCTKNISTSMNSDPAFPKGNKVTNNNFVGDVYVQMFAQKDTVHNVSLGSVTFEPGARTNWHSHPGGQILMVTDGIGYYQERGSMIRKMRKGDVIKCPHNIEHWHGASPTTSVTHIAISTNTQLGEAKWIRPVTDEEYNVKIID